MKYLKALQVVTFVAAEHAWWRNTLRTIGYVMLLLDAVYVLVSVPFRVGFIFDPWDTGPSREWTPALTTFSTLDIVGEIIRLVYIGRRWYVSTMSNPLVGSAPTSAEQTTTNASLLHLPSRRSLFSTRADAAQWLDAAVDSTHQAVATVRRTQLYVLTAGSVPLEIVAAATTYNWLHPSRVLKLVVAWHTLSQSYWALLTKWRLTQRLSFSTIAIPFYLLWLGLYLCHVCACGYIFLANFECGLESQFCSKTPVPGSWILKDSMERATLWRRYIRSAYWASKTIATLGQGDLAPTTLLETNYLVVVELMSGLWASCFLASCSFYFTRRDKDVQESVSTRLEQALRFLRARKAPAALAQHVRNYYQHIQRTRNGVEEEQILTNLPSHYRMQCRFYVKHRLLAKVPFFADQPKRFMRSITEAVENDFFSRQETILALFEVVELIVVARGRVSVLDQSKASVAMISEEEWFGEEALSEETLSRYELQANASCEVMRLSRRRFQACMEKHFPRLKIAAMIAQQKRRLAMVPSMDDKFRRRDSTSAVFTAGRQIGRSTIFKIFQQAFGSTEDLESVPWTYSGSRFRKQWRHWKVLLMIFVAVEAPYEIAFEWRVGVFGPDASLTKRVMCVVVVGVEMFFYIDWYLRACMFVCTAPGPRSETQAVKCRVTTDTTLKSEPLGRSEERLVTRPGDLLRAYVARGSLLFDVIVNSPIALVWSFLNQSSYGVISREVMRMTRLLSMGRLYYLRPTLRKIMIEFDMSPASQLLTSVVVFCIISTNAMACYFYLLADDKEFVDALPVGFDPASMPLSASDCSEQATLYGNCTWFIFDRGLYAVEARYVRSLYWSLVVLSAVGYGDILSFSNSECLLSFWWIYIGGMICFFTSCAVGSVVSQVTVLRSARDARFEEITRALNRSNVSRALRTTIRSHYQANWEFNGSVAVEKSVKEYLPRSLRHQLSSTLYVQGIRQCYVFSRLGGQAAMLREIALMLTTQVFLPGVMIVEHGHLASSMYLIQSGEVELLLPFSSSDRKGSSTRRRSVVNNSRAVQNSLLMSYSGILSYWRRRRAWKEEQRRRRSQVHGIPVAALREGGCFGEEGLLPDAQAALRLGVRTLSGTQVALLEREAFMSLAGSFPVQVRQIVTLITKKQEADSVLFDTLLANFKTHPKAVEMMGVSASLYCETKITADGIITPDKFRYQLWSFLHGVIVLYNFYGITFRLAFLPCPSESTKLALTLIDYMADLFLYIDIYLKWNRFGYEEYGDSIVDLKAIRQRYRRGWLTIDCWSMVPTYYSGDFFYMSAARLPRLLKSFQLTEYVEGLESVIRDEFMKGSMALLSVFDLFKFVVLFLSAAHQIGSLYFLLGRVLTESGIVSASWMTVDAVINAYPGNVLVQYSRAIYWSLGTFTVVCLGDVVARNLPETLFTCVTCVLSWMIIGQVVGRITSLMANIDRDRSEHTARVDNFEEYARRRSLPQYLRERATESIEFKSKCLVELNLRKTFEDLPPAMHSMLFDELYGSFMRHIPELHDCMKPAELRVLTDALRLRVYVMDDIVFEEGRLGMTLYVMKEGRAEYFSSETRIVFAAVHEGQLFGDVAFFIPNARHLLSVRASRSCQVLQLKRSTWNELWDENTRHTLEEAFQRMAEQKRKSVARAHANIAKNVTDSSSTLWASGHLQHDPDDAAVYPNERSQHQNRSSLTGYKAHFSIPSSSWRQRSRRVVPTVAHTPIGPAKKTTTTAGNVKLRRSLGFNWLNPGTVLSSSSTECSLVGLSKDAAKPANRSFSVYEHHMETIKSRFRRRQEQSAFTMRSLTTRTHQYIDDCGTAGEIWVEPSLPPSFCLESSKFRRIWSGVMYLICLYYVLTVPFRVSFSYDLLSDPAHLPAIQAWFGIEYVMDGLCVVDFVLQKDFFTFVHRGSLVTDRKAIRDHFLYEGSYLVDLFCILPLELLLPIAPLPNAPGTDSTVSWYRVAVFRINKMARIVHLRGLGQKMQRMLVYDVKVSHVRASAIYFMRMVFNFVLGAHWVACFFYGASFNLMEPAYASWLTTPGMLTFKGRASDVEVSQVPVALKYARSMHFSMGSITTVTYGDILPQNAWENYLATVVILVSIVLFGMLSGGFGRLLEMERGKRADYEEKIAGVAHLLTFHKFPARVWTHLQSYFSVHWQEMQGMDEDELLSGLPKSVKADITLFTKRDFIQHLQLFNGCDEAFVRAVVAAFDRELFVRNDVIVAHGDRGRSLYVIESGSVLVRIPQVPVVSHRPTLHSSGGSVAVRDHATVAVAPDVEIVKRRFEFFGEKSLIFDVPRSATCVALASCTMLILTVERYERILDEFPEYRERNMREWTSGKLTY